MILFSRSLIRTDFTKSPQEAAEAAAEAAAEQQLSNFKDRELKSRGQKQMNCHFLLVS